MSGFKVRSVFRRIYREAFTQGGYSWTHLRTQTAKRRLDDDRAAFVDLIQLMVARAAEHTPPLDISQLDVQKAADKLFGEKLKHAQSHFSTMAVESLPKIGPAP